MKSCSYCAEDIQDAAVLCKHCRSHSVGQADITYEDYVKERDALSKNEQSCYEGYEKAVLMLSAAFLGFSVSYLGLVKGTNAASKVAINSFSTLQASWYCFATSVGVLLLAFFVNGVAHRTTITALERRLDANKDPFRWPEVWTFTGFLLYALSGLTFLVGVVCLLRFAAANRLMP